MAQLLDYAASLWALNVEDFERQVLHPFLNAGGHTGPLPGIGEYIEEVIGEDSISGIAVADQVGQALASGEFALVVAAPQIPIGVQRVLEYLNARGQSLYGLEVSYFSGPVECFVPRLVVKPLASDPASTGSAALDEETFLAQAPEHLSDLLASFLTACGEAGADILWRSYGPSITVTRDQQRQVSWLEAKRFGVTLKASGTFPSEPFAEARAALNDLGAGAETKDAWYRNIQFADTAASELASALDVARRLVDTLAPKTEFKPLPSPIEATFTRNDHNIWAAHVAPLAGFQGLHLRGHLTHLASRQKVEIQLLPLANAQPGWRPRFLPASARDSIWPPASVGEAFDVTIDATS